MKLLKRIAAIIKFFLFSIPLCFCFLLAIELKYYVSMILNVLKSVFY